MRTPFGTPKSCDFDAPCCLSCSQTSGKPGLFTQDPWVYGQWSMGAREWGATWLGCAFEELQLENDMRKSGHIPHVYNTCTHTYKWLLQLLNKGVNKLSVWSEVVPKKMWLQLVTLPPSLYILLRVKSGYPQNCWWWWWWGIHNKLWSKNISRSKHAGYPILANFTWFIDQLVFEKMTSWWLQILVRANGMLREILRFMYFSEPWINAFFLAGEISVENLGF
jgi:hypothetical protein